MKTLLKYSLASLVVCLCLSVLAMPKGQTKKFTIRGHVEGHITAVFKDGSFTTHEVDIGESTFWGRHYNDFTALYVPDGQGNFVTTFAGTSTAANRKGAINWVGTSVPVPTVTFTGGTGEAVGIQGGFTSTVSNLQINPDGTLSYDYLGHGEATFP